MLQQQHLEEQPADPPQGQEGPPLPIQDIPLKPAVASNFAEVATSERGGGWARNLKVESQRSNQRA